MNETISIIIKIKSRLRIPKFFFQLRVIQVINFIIIGAKPSQTHIASHMADDKDIVSVFFSIITSLAQGFLLEK